MSKPIDPKRLFGVVILGLGLFILSLELSAIENFDFKDSLFWNSLMSGPGLLFGLAISIGMRLSVLKSFILVAISTIIYYTVVKLMSYLILHSSWTFQILVIVFGSVLELMAIAIIAQSISKVKWWCYLAASGIGTLAFLLMEYPLFGDTPELYTYVIFWQLAMTWLIYLMVKRTNSRINQSAV